MEQKFTRLFIYIADLMRISGKSERTCSKMMKDIRKQFKLLKHQSVTVFHASEFFGIPLDLLRPYILSLTFITIAKM